MSDNTTEILPIVDENGQVIGKAPREECHFQEGLKPLHPVVHLHLFDLDGGLFLQLRPGHKEVQPGRWDTAVGGHVSFGESIETSLKRECREEIGIDPEGAILLKKYIWETEVERELVYLYYLKSGQSPTIHPDELADGRFWEPEEIMNAIGKGIFTPNLEKEIKMLRGIL